MIKKSHMVKLLVNRFQGMASQKFNRLGVVLPRSVKIKLHTSWSKNPKWLNFWSTVSKAWPHKSLTVCNNFVVQLSQSVKLLCGHALETVSQKFNRWGFFHNEV